MKTQHLSEFSLINRIRARSPKYGSGVIKGIGDDAAVVKATKDKYILYTCDALVSGEHFLEEYSSAYQIGRKAAVINISDIASMGGTPKHFLISLFLPKNTTQKFIDELYRGLNEECNRYKIDIIGGNISRSDQFIIDLFLIGEVSSSRMLLRSGAKVEDLVLVTGELGDSAAGLKVLQNPNINIPDDDKQRLITRHLIPVPRLKEALLIAKLKEANSMIDISDGLSSDLGHICDESKVGVRLFEDKLPVSGSMKKVALTAEISWMDLALHGGEDYELCFTVPKKYLAGIYRELEKTPTKVTVIGEIIPKNQGRWIINNKGKEIPFISKGWDHLL